MKLYKKVLIAVGSTVFVVFGIFLVLIKIVLEQSWLWFIIPLIFSIGVWAVVGITLGVNYYKKKKPVYEEIKLEDAEKKAIYEMKYDEENPDNFSIKERKTLKIGIPGSERTPIRVHSGYGSELMEERHFLINLKNPNDWTILINPTKEELTDAIIKLADAQPTIEVMEKISAGLDQWGNPQTSVKVTRQTQAQVKEQKATEEAEEQSAY